ncbi:MAG: glycosyltransferase, partial [Acidobacteriota bacterium]|nr:glycosyltransferase [Acidobacteriota bacterium]
MWYVLLAVAAFGLLTSTVFTGMTLAAVPRFLRERRAALANLKQRPGFTPPLTLLKPMHGADPGLEAYLETFFTQDYPNYEILFCARSEGDAGLAIARRVAERHPNIPAKFLSTGGQPDWINDKAISMEHMLAMAAHDILVISDSDVLVAPEYLRAVALPFADARVGGMCCPYRGVAAEGGLWARLEAVGMSVEMTAGVLVARMMEGMQFTLGPTMAFRKQTVQRMGGFGVTADYCADDFILGNETHKAGETVVLSTHAIDH